MGSYLENTRKQWRNEAPKKVYLKSINCSENYSLPYESLNFIT